MWQMQSKCAARMGVTTTAGWCLTLYDTLLFCSAWWFTYVLQRHFFQGFSLICLPPVVCLRGLFIECAWDYWQVEHSRHGVVIGCCQRLGEIQSEPTRWLEAFWFKKPPNCVDWRWKGSSLRPIKEGPSCDAGGDPYIKMQLALTSISVSRSVRVIIFWWIFPTVNMTEEMRKFGGDNLKFQPELERIIHFSCWGVLVFRMF